MERHCNVDGTATDVNSVDFCDFNNDGKLEIIVCWSVVSKQTGTSINVYSQNENDNKYSLKSISKAITGSNFICVDANDDGVMELLVLQLALRAKTREQSFIRLEQVRGSLSAKQGLTARLLRLRV